MLFLEYNLTSATTRSVDLRNEDQHWLEIKDYQPAAVSCSPSVTLC